MDQIELAEQQAEELAEAEKEAVEAATDDFNLLAANMLAIVRAGWPNTDAPEPMRLAIVRRLNITKLLSLAPDIRRAVESYLPTAGNLGVSSAEKQLKNIKVEVPETVRFFVSEEVRKALDGITQALGEQVMRARAALLVAHTDVEAENAIHIAMSARHRIESATRFAMQRHAANTFSSVVQETPVKRIWKPERDACVHCLAYAGKVRGKNGFEGGLTYGKKPLSEELVVNPPLHPNCRCSLIIVRPSDNETSKGLEREAKRSVLRGFSTESESNSVRIDAAQRLLVRGTSLPQSVKNYAAKAVKAGQFPRGRKFPDG